MTRQQKNELLSEFMETLIDEGYEIIPPKPERNILQPTRDVFNNFKCERHDHYRKLGKHIFKKKERYKNVYVPSVYPERYFKLEDAWTRVRWLVASVFDVSRIDDIPKDQKDRANDYAGRILNAYFECYMRQDLVEEAKGDTNA